MAPTIVYSVSFGDINLLAVVSVGQIIVSGQHNEIIGLGRYPCFCGGVERENPKLIFQWKDCRMFRILRKSFGILFTVCLYDCWIVLCVPTTASFSVNLPACLG